MGGTCDEAMTAATPDEMIALGMKHLEVAHPEMAADIEKMPKDDPMMVKWYGDFMKKWEAAPENS
jgi:hypothetical protein